MEPNKLLDILHTAERLKDTLRHCDTSKGRRESVAEHSWRLALMAFFLRDEFPDTDIDRVIRMCLIHDLGECFTGDIPSFLKTDADTEKEDALLERCLELPDSTREAAEEILAQLLTAESRPYTYAEMAGIIGNFDFLFFVHDYFFGLIPNILAKLFKSSLDIF